MLMEEKCVLVADSSLPAGVLANTAAILGVTLGVRFPQAVGPDVADGSGALHPGIITLPIPVLKSNAAGLRALRSRLGEPPFEGVFTADFSDVARRCRTYPEYVTSAAGTPEREFTYLALLLWGPKSRSTGSQGAYPFCVEGKALRRFFYIRNL